MNVETAFEMVGLVGCLAALHAYLRGDRRGQSPTLQVMLWLLLGVSLIKYAINALEWSGLVHMIRLDPLEDYLDDLWPLLWFLLFHALFAEDARDELKKYQQMVTSTSDWLSLIDHRYVYLAANDAFLAAMARSREHTVGRSMAEVFGRTVFDQILKERIDHCLKGHDVSFADWFDTPGRGRVYLDTAGYPVRSKDGAVSGVVALHRDATEIKNLHARLRHAHKMEALGTIAGGVAHNFNNLLMSIEGNASLGLMETPPTDPNHSRLSNISKMVQSGSKLTRQLLGYAREGRYKVQPVDVNHLVRESAATFAATHRDIRVHLDLSPEVPAVQADQNQIEQALLNLFVNAADAMPHGGDIYLTTRRTDQTVIPQNRFRATPGQYVCIGVRDTGTGIEESIQDRIFDPFFTTKEMGKGTGLGLASVYGIVKGHNGHIAVTSQPGQGTCFTIYLRAGGPSPTVAPHRVPDRLRAGRGRILLVDDEPQVLEVTGQLLVKLGYDVLPADSGQKALELLAAAQEPVDLVLLDMIMPDMRGSETYDRLRRLQPDLKVILSSGFSLNEEAQAIMQRGCNGFLQKPFSMRTLSEKLHDVLGGGEGLEDTAESTLPAGPPEQGGD